MAEGFGAGFTAGFGTGSLAGYRKNVMDLEKRKYADTQYAKELERTAGALLTMAVDPKTGRMDFGKVTSPQGEQQLNALIQASPEMSKRLAEQMLPGTEAARRGLTRHLVGVRSTKRGESVDALPDAVVPIIEWRDKKGKVVSKGPMTQGSTADPNDQVVMLDGGQLGQAVFGLAAGSNKEVRDYIVSSAKLEGRRSNAIELGKLLRGKRQAATGAPAAPASTDLGAAATPRPTTAPAAPTAPGEPAVPGEPEAPAAEPTDVVERAKATVKERQVEKAKGEITQLEGSRGRLAKRLAYQEQILERRINDPRGKERDIKRQTSIVENTRKALEELDANIEARRAGEVPERGEPLPQVGGKEVAPDVADRMRELASKVTEEEKAAAAKTLRKKISSRGSSKLTDAQLAVFADALINKNIDAAQFARGIRTGSLNPRIKAAMSDMMGGLIFYGEEGVEGHYRNPAYAAMKMIQARSKAAGDKLKNIKQYDEALRGRFGGLFTEVFGKQPKLDEPQWTKFRDMLSATVVTLGINPLDDAESPLVSNAVRDWQTYRREKGPRWWNLWMREPTEFESLSPFIIKGATGGASIDETMGKYYGPVRQMWNKASPNTLPPAWLSTGYARTLAGAEKRIGYEAAVKFNNTFMSDNLNWFKNPAQLIKLLDQRLASGQGK